MGTDYFTIEEFQVYAKDNKSPRRYDPADVDMAQDEVTEMLEQWAGSAWPTIAPPISGEVRQWVDRFSENTSIVLLTKRPVISYVTVTNAGGDLTLDADFTSDLDAGIIRFQQSVVLAPLIVTYEYGYDVTPQVIKTPVMHAVRTLLDGRRPGSRIPEGTRQYTSEGTTIVMGESPTSMADPWPWDETASDMVFSYWDKWRPKTLLSLG